MANFRPHKFGRYVIVDPIAVGGMAEIYRARLATAKGTTDGPDRIIVIKKVIANLSQNSEFLQMFESEIKITVGLTHPNIVQIYDYGRVSDQSFLAMEYVEGKNLRQFVTRLAEMKSMFSIDMSCHIVSQICQALSYAHNFKDRFSGKSLQIVHRDISPQNIMLSYEGAVKLFDFGIAKAKSAGESTRAGVIKGKPSYLSPEQIEGEELDGRSDIFALGIVLWELLTAKRLFVAENDMAILRMIQSAKIEPPSTFNPAVPQGLDAIVLKSLARDRNKRYPSAEEFQRDLHRFLYSFNPGFNPSDLSYYAKELFDKEIRDDRDRLMKYLSIEAVDDSEPEVAPAAKVKAAVKPKSNHAPVEGIMTTEEFNRAAVEEILATSKSSTVEEKPSQNSTIEIDHVGNSNPSIKTITPPGVGARRGIPPSSDKGSRLDIAGVGWANRSSLPPPNPGAAKRGSSDVIPPWSKDQNTSAGVQATAYQAKRGSRTNRSQLLEIEMDSYKTSGIKWMSLVMVAVAVFALAFIGGQWGLFDDTPLAEFVGTKRVAKVSPKNGDGSRTPASTQDEASGHDIPASERVSDKPATGENNLVANPMPAAVPAIAGTQAIILLKAREPGILENLKVSINGISVKVVGNQISVPIKKQLTIKFAAKKFESSTVNVEVPDTRTVGMNVELKPLPIGLISFSTVPTAQLVFHDLEHGQEPFVENSPLNNYSLAEGKYRVHIENSLVGYSSDIDVQIICDRLTVVPEKILK